MTEQLQDIIVRNIIETRGNISRVTVDTNTFKAVTGRRPLLPYTPRGDKGGLGVREFHIGDATLYVQYTKFEEDKPDTGITKFFMDKNTAQAKLLTIEQERAGEEKLDFSAAEFTADLTNS